MRILLVACVTTGLSLSAFSKSQTYTVYPGDPSASTVSVETLLASADNPSSSTVSATLTGYAVVIRRVTGSTDASAPWPTPFASLYDSSYTTGGSFPVTLPPRKGARLIYSATRVTTRMRYTVDRNGVQSSIERTKIWEDSVSTFVRFVDLVSDPGSGGG